jgi:hypothetical protein
MDRALPGKHRGAIDGLDRHTDCVVHRLVYGRFHPTALVSNVPDLSDLPRRIVRQPQLHELALLVHIINSLQRLLEGNAAIRCVQVEDVHLLRIQLFQTRRSVRFQFIRGMDTCFVWIHFRGEGQAAVFPLRVAGEGFLLASNVHARRVDFIVAL